MEKEVKIFSDIESLNKFAADKFVEIYQKSIVQKKKFAVALAGGSTPKALYQLLAGDQYKYKIDWSRVFFFFGDERNVPPGDDESNFRMARETLFEPLKINAENIYRWPTELDDPQRIVEDYTQNIKNFFDLESKPPAGHDDSILPRFDLILLGMGDDGHTASLFPETKALFENQKIAVPNWVEKFNNWRFTLTFPTINNAENVIFLITGQNKAETVKEVLEGEFTPVKLPSQNIKPSGKLYFLLDKDASVHLPNL